jgi:hypothetical protein
MLEIMKWYSIIWLTCGALVNLWESIKEREFRSFIAFILIIPMIVYLIIK